MSDMIVFGPALLQAYKIESEIAQDPRVVLGEDAVKLVQWLMKHPGKSPGYYGSVFLTDYDGKWFVNYLQYAYKEAHKVSMFESFDLAFWGIIKAHKQEVEQKLVKYRTDRRVLSKYLWIANYHNYFCREHREVVGDLVIQDPALWLALNQSWSELLPSECRLKDATHCKNL